MKKITALLLALLMIVSLAACGGNGSETTEPDTTVADTTEVTTEGTTVEGITYFSMNMSKGEAFQMMSASVNDDGTVAVEYMGDIRKKADLDASVMTAIEEALSNSGLVELNGQQVYLEGDVSGTAYVSFADGTSITADFGGELPEAFTNAYKAMEACFQTITADVEEYVPQPQVVGEIAEGDKTALDAILSGMTLEVPDAFMISGIAKDEYFAVSMGLSSDEGIASGVLFKPMMMPGDYTLSIVTLEEGTSTEDVVSSFESAMDWHKNICPPYPTTALIATKDNQVLCLMGSDDLFTQTASAIAAAGWTTVYSLTNPDLA